MQSNPSMNPQEQKLPLCPGRCAKGAEDEEPIPCGEAYERYGVCGLHGLMPTNRELRFRLNNIKDGSAYIRTQTTPESEGWQKSHYHEHLKETYIVEKGWIGYAELKDDRALYRRYYPGHLFTIQPKIVHNIFMSADSVIHTVKHNGHPPKSEGDSDWWRDERCEILASLLKPEFPKHIPIEEDTDPEKTYNAAYRHFDTLIWQLPAWSTAIFAAIVASVNSFLAPSAAQGTATRAANQTVSTIASLFNLPSNIYLAIPVSLFGVFTLVLSYALFRFRWHQIATKTWSLDSASPIFSPQLLLQFVVSVEAALLIVLSSALVKMPGMCVVPLLLIVVFFCLGERHLYKRHITLNPPNREGTHISQSSRVRGNS